MKGSLIVGALVALICVAHAQTTTHPPTAAPKAQTPPASLTCAGDRVVWVNTASKVYHPPGDRYYGATKQGKFICEKTAITEGDHVSKK